ncbi:MAG: EAL domain-containing protein, partial [Proteobacteria bacterium]|nr:EAL domain-containing protein [Pseudomonadota bacterium]
GVETKAQRAFLHKYGCDYAQGYYYAQALPVAEIEQILTGTRPLVPKEHSIDPHP